MKFKSAIITFIAVILLSGCWDKDEDKDDTNATLEQKTTEILQTETEQESSKDDKISYNEAITLKFLGENSLELKARNGGFDIKNNEKATLLVFFTTWCPPCRAEIPHLNNLSEKFIKDLNVVGVLLEDKSENVIKEFVKKYKIKYDVALGEGAFLLERAVGGVIGLPFSILYKPNGDHVITYTGLVPEEMLENDIKKAIK